MLFHLSLAPLVTIYWQEDLPNTERNLKAMDASPKPQASLEGIVSLNASESHRVFEGLTTQYYTTLEVWYIRTSIDKVTFSLITS
jgi:hypothetical protein